MSEIIHGIVHDETATALDASEDLPFASRLPMGEGASFDTLDRLGTSAADMQRAAVLRPQPITSLPELVADLEEQKKWDNFANHGVGKTTEHERVFRDFGHTNH